MTNHKHIFSSVVVIFTFLKNTITRAMTENETYCTYSQMR